MTNNKHRRTFLLTSVYSNDQVPSHRLPFAHPNSNSKWKQIIRYLNWKPFPIQPRLRPMKLEIKEGLVFPHPQIISSRIHNCRHQLSLTMPLLRLPIPPSWLTNFSNSFCSPCRNIHRTLNTKKIKFRLDNCRLLGLDRDGGDCDQVKIHQGKGKLGNVVNVTK